MNWKLQFSSSQFNWVNCQVSCLDELRWIVQIAVKLCKLIQCTKIMLLSQSIQQLDELCKLSELNELYNCN